MSFTDELRNNIKLLAMKEVSRFENNGKESFGPLTAFLGDDLDLGAEEIYPMTLTLGG